MPRPGFVYVDAGRLFLDGQPFRHIGVNIPGLAYYGTGVLPFSAKADQDTNLFAFSQMGAAAVRIFGANAQISPDQAAALINDLADRALGLYAMRLLVSLTDLFCNYHQAPGDSAFCRVSPSGLAILSHDWFAGGFRQNYVPWVRTLVRRLKDHSGIFAWELGNELKDESFPQQLLDFTREVVAEIRAIDPDHLISTGNNATFSLLNSQQAIVWYTDVDVVQTHNYEGNRTGNDVALARQLGRGHIVGEAGFTPPGCPSGQPCCGLGGRGGLLQGDLGAWFNELGTDGYYQWGAQAQPRDINDGDNRYGLDRYCHTDFDDLYAIYANFARGFPLPPPPPPPPPPPQPPPTAEGTLGPLLVGLGIGAVAAGVLAAEALGIRPTLELRVSDVREIEPGEPVPPGFEVIG